MISRGLVDVKSYINICETEIYAVFVEVIPIFTYSNTIYK